MSDDFHLGVWSFTCKCLHDSELCSHRDDFIPVFSTVMKIYPGMKNSCKHDAFSRPGGKTKTPRETSLFNFRPGMKLVTFHPGMKSSM